MIEFLYKTQQTLGERWLLNSGSSNDDGGGGVGGTHDFGGYGDDGGDCDVLEMVL